MCATCGCSEDKAAHGHDHGHSHDHGHDHAPGVTLRLEEGILARNDAFAERNRAWFRERSILALNLVSSPGSGKTTLLARTIRDLRGRLPISVIEGDQATSIDADRIRAAGAAALQVNTGTACHLDAHQVGHALGELRPADHSCVVVENVGNLICPSLFDLGEEQRVLVASVAEGDDKPLKYPHMFRSADLVVLNKIDLLPHVAFDADHFRKCIREVNPDAGIFSVSATRGDGLSEWYDWLLCSSRRPASV
ncbi:MAG: hydrogenase nickel incorporation protein HypB [Planctomycetes bacterium]|nr:hydrogenase nickel incorporation protein HypB [Planctomycetota bacterium]